MFNDDFNDFHLTKESIAEFFRKLNMRIVLMIALVCVLSGVLIVHLFNLQIVNGEDYQNNFQLQIKREIDLPSTRGNIYDRNGKLLAYNDLAYSVVIRDESENSDNPDKTLNDTINQTIQIIEQCGDSVTADFDIEYDKNSGSYAFTVSDSGLPRFLADVYGHSDTADLSYKERTSTADDVMAELCSRYNIDTQPEGTESEEEAAVRKLQIVAVRYNLSLNSYQQYLATTIAYDVSEKTVAAISENSSSLSGVEVEEDTARKYVDSKYFAHIMGYTGKVSTEELETLQEENPDAGYTSNDIVGKSGIEKSMESYLQGKKGKKVVYVDVMGKELETVSTTEPVAGNDVYLSIDKDLTEAAYNILEKKLSEILTDKLIDAKEYDGDAASSTAKIPIYDAYFAVIRNNVLDISHFSAEDASETEKSVYSSFITYRQSALDKIDEEIRNTKTPYNQLTDEMKNYQSYIVQLLYDNGAIDQDKIDTEDETYQNWTTRETISLNEYLMYCIAQNWVDVEKIGTETKYSDSRQIFERLCEYIQECLADDDTFASQYLYHYMLLNDVISGEQICHLLLDQGCVSISEEEEAQFLSGEESAFDFMYNRIKDLDLTPAQLNLDPYSGSMVITDCNTGQVLAMVSYPGYDNNKMSNGVDAEYYEQLRNDQSTPLINYATQQRTAPGSTFKPCSATAALCEGVIDTDTKIVCTGIFTKVSPSATCWIYPGAHGSLDVTGGIANSCNGFFYEVGYRLGTVTQTQEDGTVKETYDSDTGVAKLQKYAALYGLNETSGVEIEEADPIVSDEDSVRSAIGQARNSYTTTQLARYAATVANSGTCYDLTLIDHISDASGNTVYTQQPSVAHQIDMDSSYWDAIHSGMKQVVEQKTYFNEIPVTIASKTGTAQQTNRPNHALFICYAPYEDPQIAVATRVANGYSSDYAAQITEEVLAYYYGVKSENDILQEETGMSTTTAGD